MKRWVIVPVKKLAAAKSRLAPALSAKERRLLARRLLDHTLKVLRNLNGIEGIIVVSKDRAALAAAGKSGAQFVPEGKCDGLNRALARAVKEAVRRGAEAILVLPADLPLLRTRDLAQAVRLARRRRFVVIAPDRGEEGTNLLYFSPPGIIKFSFGERSFKKHLQSARRKKIRVSVLRTLDLAQDIDRPEDLSILRDPFQVLKPL
jgi:2-phospho-L-lactate/phosphoenolpyruvate guanylyltransferase